MNRDQFEHALDSILGSVERLHDTKCRKKMDWVDLD